MFGYSFDPNRKDNTQGALPTGQALQVISTHLPKVLGARAVSSPQLLAGGNRGPSAESVLMQSILRAKMGSGSLGGDGQGESNPALDLIRQISSSLDISEIGRGPRMPHVVNAMPPESAPPPPGQTSPLAPEGPMVAPPRMPSGPAFGGMPRRGWS